MKWKTMDKYFDKKHDWVIVQFEEIRTGFRGLPHIAEWRARKDKQGWFLQDDDREEYFVYINVNCKPIAFCELPVYKGNKNESNND